MIRLKTKIIYQDFITRKDLRNNPNKVYLFGDNDVRRGMAGQAKEMRGELNAIGIRVKKFPRMRSEDFYTDKEYKENIRKINSDLAIIDEAINMEKDIVIPKAGIGTGLADLKNKAPKTFAYLQNRLRRLK